MYGSAVELCRCDNSSRHLHKLFRGGREHGVQGAGQLPAVVGEMIPVTVGELADQAVVAQEAEMPADTGRKLLIGSTGAPWRSGKALTESGIGDARDGESRIADGLE